MFCEHSGRETASPGTQCAFSGNAPCLISKVSFLLSRTIRPLNERNALVVILSVNFNKLMPYFPNIHMDIHGLDCGTFKWSVAN